jgi:hypothetical protein
LLFTPGDGFNSVEFGPSATIPLLDTAQIGLNAATSVYTLSVASAFINALPAYSSWTVSTPAITNAATMVVTVTGNVVTANLAASVELVQARLIDDNNATEYNSGFPVMSGYFEFDSPPATGNYFGSFAIERTFAVAAGVASQYSLFMCSGGASSAGLSDLKMKVEVIKR